jgi:hypothetical protein
MPPSFHPLSILRINMMQSSHLFRYERHPHLTMLTNNTIYVDVVLLYNYM